MKFRIVNVMQHGTEACPEGVTLTLKSDDRDVAGYLRQIMMLGWPVGLHFIEPAVPDEFVDVRNVLPTIP